MPLLGKWFLLLCLVLAAGNIQAQKKEAEAYFEQGKYFKALKLYNLYDKIDRRPDALIKRAICNYHSNRLDNCILDLKKAFSQGKRSPEIFLYLGKSYHNKEQFETAADFYKLYLDKVKKNPELRRKAIVSIKQCGYATDAQFYDEKGFVENLGISINTRADEMVAIQSPNMPNKYYFSSNREGSTGGLRSARGLEDLAYGSFKMDLYFTVKENGSWTEPEELNPLINTSRSEILQDINDDGSILYYTAGLNDDQMVFMVDTFSATHVRIERDPLIGPFVAELGDKDLVSVNDSTFIFSSKRIGGMGGYDLYVTAFRNGEWQETFNLGSSINTPYDEICPWVTNDGNTLYFSSNGLNSFGDFDIYTSNYDPDNKEWSLVENMSLPINSSSDDLYFRVSNDGKIGSFSSNRKSGEGGYDLYQCFLKTVVASQKSKGVKTDLFSSYKMEKQEILDKQTRIDSIFRAENITGIDTTSFTNYLDSNNIAQPLKKKLSLVVEPFFYGEDDNMLTSDNIRKLNVLADALLISPQIRVLLISNAVSEDLAEFDLYFSFKRGEKILKYLEDKGVKEQQLILVGAGSNYPLVKERLNGKRVNEAEIYNRRIDAYLFNYESSAVEVESKMPKIKLSISDKSHENFIQKLIGLRYRVKVGMDKNMIKSDIVYDNTDVLIQNTTGKNLYTAGIFETYESARNHSEQLRLRGIKDPEIIPFLDSRILNQNEVLGLSETYPDLAIYYLEENR